MTDLQCLELTRLGVERAQELWRYVPQTKVSYARKMCGNFQDKRQLDLVRWRIDVDGEW